MTNEQAGIWLRVSTSKQDEEAQAPDCARYAATRGYSIAATYTLHGASAHKGNKRFDAAWAGVLDDIRHGKITVLVVWRLSRLDRKLEAFQMIKEVRDLGARIEFAMQPHLNDLSTMAGRIALKVEEELAFAESEEKFQRGKASIAMRKAQGRNTGRYPWGLEPADTGVLRVSAGAKDVIKYVFEQIVKGKSPGAVAAALDSSGRVPRCHTLWVKRMIANEAYRGLAVDRATFDLAGAALLNAPVRGRSGSRPKPLLKPRCLRCGGPLFRHFRRDGMEMYRCYGQREGQAPGKRGCGMHVPMAEADARVTAMFADDDSPHTVWQYTAGDDVDERLRDAQDAGAKAMRAGDLEEAQRLMSLIAELQQAPRVAAAWREVPTGQTRAKWWADASDDERRDFLARMPITVGRVDGAVVIRLGAPTLRV